MDLDGQNIAVGSVPESDCTASPQVAETGETLAHENNISSPISPELSPSDGSPLPSKGFGLRKWRRIRRDFIKDDCILSEASKALKRGPSFTQHVNKPSISIVAETLHNSEDSSGSVNMLMDPFIVPSASNSSSIFASQGVDSEHSDCRSSTAGSAQRLRYNPHSSSNHKANITPNNFRTLSQHPLEERVKSEGSKKQRGGESEHSHSSLESDSRSFVQEVTSTNKSAMYSVDDNDHQFNVTEPVTIERATGNDNLTASEDNGTNFPDKENGYPSEQEVAFENDQKLKSSDESFLTDGFHSMNGKMADPLADTLKELESLHAALQSELNKFGEIRTDNGARLTSDDEQSTGNDDVERPQVMELRKMVNELESKLEEVVHCQNAKESNCDGELEEIFRQKIESEIAYLTMAESLKRCSVYESKGPLTGSGKGSDRRMCLLSVLSLVIFFFLWFLLTEVDLQRMDFVPT